MNYVKSSGDEDGMDLRYIIENREKSGVREREEPKGGIEASDVRVSLAFHLLPPVMSN